MFSVSHLTPAAPFACIPTTLFDQADPGSTRAMRWECSRGTTASRFVASCGYIAVFGGFAALDPGLPAPISISRRFLGRKLEFAVMSTCHGLCRDHKTTMLLGAPPVGRRSFPKAVCDATERTPSLVDRLSTLKELSGPRGSRASGGERVARSKAPFEGRIGRYPGRKV